jgi:hypothetical protein
VTPEPALPFAQIVLAVRCVETGAPVERLPEPQAERIAGIAIPLTRLDAREASAPAKLRRALLHLGHGL